MPKRSRGLGRVTAGQSWSQGLVQETGTFGHSRKRVHVLPPVQAGRPLPRAHSITCFTGFNSRIKSPKEKTKACVLEGMRSLNDPRQGRPARALQRVGATGETKKAAQRLFGNQALTVIPVTPLSPPPRHLQAKTDASVPIRPLILTPAQRVRRS